MDYKNNFENKNTAELLELVSEPGSLSYEAKLGLKEVMESRKIAIPDSLIGEINSEEKQIESLKYLRNLGFSFDKDDGKILVLRRWTFIIVDIVTLIIGVLMSYLITISWNSMKTIYADGLSFNPLLIGIVSLLIGLLGLGLFYRSLNRLVEYSGFSITKDPSGTIIVKKSGSEFIESVLTNSLFEVRDKDSYKVLVYSQIEGEELELIRTRGGIRHQQTLYHLKTILSNK